MVPDEEETVIDGVSSALSKAKDAVGDLSSGDSAAAATTDAPAGPDGESSGLDSLADFGSSLLGGAKDVLTGRETMGGAVGGALDSLGLPDWATDFAGAAVDYKTGNIPGAIEHGASGIGHVAEEAGAEGVADFAHTASDVTGMYNDVQGSIMGGRGIPGGVSAVADGLDDLGGRADGLADQGEIGIETAEAAHNGDGAEATRGLCEMVGSGIEVSVPQLAEGDHALSRALEDGVRLVVSVEDEFDDPGEATGLSTGEVLDRIGEDPEFADRLAEEVLALIEEFNADGGDEPVGTRIAESQAGEAFVERLVEIAEDHRTFADVDDVEARQVVTASVDSARGILDVADRNPEVAIDIVGTLERTGAASASTNVSEIRGAEIRG